MHAPFCIENTSNRYTIAFWFERPSEMYLWLKLFHIFFVISWFAGLFYLPRIFVNLAMSEPGSQEYIRLSEMARRLYRFMSPLGWGTVLFGIGILEVNHWWGGWGTAKLLIGVLLLAYQLYCGRLLAAFCEQRNSRGHKWYRVFNELPVLLLGAALYFVVFKPF